MLCAGLLVSAMIALDTTASFRPSDPDPTNSPFSAAAGSVCARDALGQQCQAVRLMSRGAAFSQAKLHSHVG
jgi:hypothetical protein